MVEKTWFMCRCPTGECDPVCEAPQLRAEIERLRSERERLLEANAALHLEIERYGKRR